MSLLTLSDISKKNKESYSVKAVSFAQKPLQKLAIAGETGSGKTTLLKLIAGWIQPDEGTIFFKGEKVLGPYEQLIPGRKEIAYLSQHFELRNNYWVNEILEYANELTLEEANKLYAVCRIEHLLNRRTDQLSGGEKQRIALARLLSSSPQLLLLDEPFSNLDRPHKKIIQSVIEDIGTQLNITCMLVSHDAQDVLGWADTLLLLKEGRILQEGTPEEVYNKPANEYCASLLGEYNLIDADYISVFAGEELSKKWRGKKVLIRPEQFHIVQPGDKAVKGIIYSISFYGNYYSIGVLLGKKSIRVQTGTNNFAVGNEIWLMVSPEQLHSI